MTTPFPIEPSWNEAICDKAAGPYKTVNAAIAALPSTGGTVYIEDGTYSDPARGATGDNIGIRIDNPPSGYKLTLIGRSRTGTILGTGLAVETSGIDVEIRNMTILPGEHDISVYIRNPPSLDTTYWHGNVLVEDCDITATDAEHYGIRVEALSPTESGSITIQNCAVTSDYSAFAVGLLKGAGNVTSPISITAADSQFTSNATTLTADPYNSANAIYLADGMTGNNFASDVYSAFEMCLVKSHFPPLSLNLPFATRTVVVLDKCDFHNTDSSGADLCTISAFGTSSTESQIEIDSCEFTLASNTAATNGLHFVRGTHNVYVAMDNTVVNCTTLFLVEPQTTGTNTTHIDFEVKGGEFAFTTKLIALSETTTVKPMGDVAFEDIYLRHPDASIDDAFTITSQRGNISTNPQSVGKYVVGSGCRYTSLQEALNDAALDSAGEKVVYLRPGMYSDSSGHFNVPSGVSIRGAGRGLTTLTSQLRFGAAGSFEVRNVSLRPAGLNVNSGIHISYTGAATMDLNFQDIHVDIAGSAQMCLEVTAAVATDVAVTFRNFAFHLDELTGSGASHQAIVVGANTGSRQNFTLNLIHGNIIEKTPASLVSQFMNLDGNRYFDILVDKCIYEGRGPFLLCEPTSGRTPFVECNVYDCNFKEKTTGSSEDFFFHSNPVETCIYVRNCKIDVNIPFAGTVNGAWNESFYLILDGLTGEYTNALIHSTITQGFNFPSGVTRTNGALFQVKNCDVTRKRDSARSDNSNAVIYTSLGRSLPGNHLWPWMNCQVYENRFRGVAAAVRLAGQANYEREVGIQFADLDMEVHIPPVTTGGNAAFSVAPTMSKFPGGGIYVSGRTVVNTTNGTAVVTIPTTYIIKDTDVILTSIEQGSVTLTTSNNINVYVERTTGQKNFKLHVGTPPSVGSIYINWLIIRRD